MFSIIGIVVVFGCIAADYLMEHLVRLAAVHQTQHAKNHHAVAFVCDTMRMAVSGGVEVYSIWIRCWRRIWKSMITTPTSRCPG